MPRLNLISPIFPGGDKSEISQGSIDVINAYVEFSGNEAFFRLRPGLSEAYSTGQTGKVYLFWWETRGYLIACVNRRILVKITKVRNWIDITPVNSCDSLPYNGYVFFSADEYGVTMCAGRHMLWWGGDVSQKAQRITQVNQSVTALTYLKGYTIASLQNTQNFITATYGPTDNRSQPPTWNPLFLTASSQPDNIITLSSGWEELFILGRDSTESHYATGNSEIPFQLLNGSVGEIGIVNNRCLAKIANSYVFVTPNKEIVRMNGRTAEVISRPINDQLQGFNVDRSEAFAMFNRFYVVTFTKDDVTFVFDTVTNLWYKWLSWNTEQDKYNRFPGVSCVNAKSWGQQIVGGQDGQVYVANYAENTDAGNVIRLEITTANIDYGTLKRKFPQNLTFRLKRGY